MDAPVQLPTVFALRKGLFPLVVSFLAGITFTIFILLSYAIALALEEVRKGTLTLGPVLLTGVINAAIFIAGGLLMYHVYRATHQRIEIRADHMLLPMPWYNTWIPLSEIVDVRFIGSFDIQKRWNQPRMDFDRPKWVLDWMAKRTGQKVIIMSNTAITDVVEIETRDRLYHVSPETPEIFVQALKDKARATQAHA